MTIRFLILSALGLALSCGGNLPAQSQDLESVSKALASDRAPLRRQALQSAIDWQAPEMQARLVALVREDTDPTVRALALDRLAEAPDTHAALFRERAEKDSNPGTRSAAVRALGLCRREIDHDFLVATLASGDRVAAAAAEALGESGRPEAFEPLARLLRTCGRNGWLGPAVPRALMRLDAKRALPLLLDGLVEARSPRYWIAQELKEAGAKAALPRAVALLDDDDAMTRRLAASIVGALGGEEAVEPILTAMAAHRDEKPAYITALGAIGSPRSIPVLMKALAEDLNVEVRRAAAGALVRVPPRGRQIEIEGRLAREADGLVLVLLCELLADLGDRRSIAALVPRLIDERRSDQPMRLSSVLPYPWNVELGEAAGHAIITLRDGTNPMPRSELAVFPADRSDLPQSTRARMWWEELEDRSPYSRTD